MNKGNIKIMSKAPEVSDEEIRQMMNFTDLIEKQKAVALQKAKWNRKVKTTTIAGSALIVLTLIYVYWPAATSIPTPVKSKIIALDSLSKGANSNLPSRKKPEEITEVENKKKATSIKRKEAEEKQSATIQNAGPDNSTIKTTPLPQPVQYTEAEPTEGFPHLYDYFNRQLTYPPAALKDSIQGIVTISFIINKQGKAENFQIINSLGAAFDQEALRVMKDMPTWKPATVNNKPIASKISLPLTFNFHTGKQK